tara:strand:- start:2120 stop:2323 length:204 start_codon:yes stop_codon:yes gene_type:complete
MSDSKKDKLKNHLRALEKRHRELDNHIQEEFKKHVSDDVIRKLKTQKLWLKDEIHRINLELVQLNLT